VAHEVANRPMRVVLVEDAPFLRYAFARLLRMYGFEVREAVDGFDALESIAEFRPDLVLTDLMMPDMDGIELIKRLHDDPKTANLPVVAITADSTEQAERQAREAGAREVIIKPIDFTSLLDQIHALDLMHN
jgi:CheY-like chemotaxis protein